MNFLLNCIIRINNVRSTNGGRYRCTVRTPQGENTKDYSLAITGSVTRYYPRPEILLLLTLCSLCCQYLAW